MYGKTSKQELKKFPINQTLGDSHKISNPMILSIDPEKFQWTRYRQYFTIKRSFTYGYTRDQDNKKK